MKRNEEEEEERRLSLERKMLEKRYKLDMLKEKQVRKQHRCTTENTYAVDTSLLMIERWYDVIH